MISPPTPRQFLLNISLHSNLHTHFICSSPNSHDSPYQVGFANLDLLLLFLSVSTIVSSPFMYAGVTHELSTFPLSLHELRLSAITSSIFLQALNLPRCNPHYSQSKFSIRSCTATLIMAKLLHCPCLTYPPLLTPLTTTFSLHAYQRGTGYLAQPWAGLLHILLIDGKPLK